MTIVTRFAPSPTGYLHIGSALMGLLNFLYARHNNGKFLLRVEDTDKERSTLEAKQAILDSMKWLELDWDDEIIYQSERSDRHQEVAHELVRLGKAYYCFTPQEEINALREAAKARKESFIFRSPWRDKHSDDYPKDIKGVIRLKAPQDGITQFNDLVQGEITIQNEVLDDMVLLRSDGTPTYMLAVVVDDHDMNVSHIIRGDDHLNNASRQITIYNSLGWKIPEMAHVPLIHGPDGAKLSKRHGAVGVHLYQDQGYLPEAICNCLLRLGWSHGDDEIITRDQAIEWFDLKGVGKSPARLDFDKLLHLNGHYIKEMSDDKLVPYATKNLDTITEGEKDSIKRAMPTIKQRCHLLTELPDLACLYSNQIPNIDAELKGNIDSNIVKEFTKMLDAQENWVATDLQASCKALSASLDIKLGQLMQPVRILMTGTNKSPSLFEMMEIIGKQQTLNRLCRTL